MEMILPVLKRVCRQGLSQILVAPVVVATIQRVIPPSTRVLYAFEWQAFEQWCQHRNIVPFQCLIVDVLSFPQELLHKGLSFSTIKVYITE